VCVLENMHSTRLCIVCVDRIEVCVLCSVEIYNISFIMGIMGYDYFIYSRDMCLDFSI
jgi:hypothetical protein